MPRSTFFSFHYQNDLFRVNQIRNAPCVSPHAAAGFRDASLWESVRLSGDAAIKRAIDAGLDRTSVTVVCIGEKTAGRKWINYEIDQSIRRGNGIVALHIGHLYCIRSREYGCLGSVPYKLVANGYVATRYSGPQDLAEKIELAARAAGKPALMSVVQQHA